MDLKLIGVDDANILFVYSKHFAAGEGLVYNIGGERVEGFSSMLWMLLTSIGYLLTPEPTTLFFAFNIVLIGTAIGFAWLNIKALTGTRDPYSLSALIFLAWLAANPGYFIWTVTSLMETGLWAALLLVTTTLLLRTIHDGSLSRVRLGQFAILNVLLLLTRPESMAWVLYFLTMLLIVLRWQGQTVGSLARGWLLVVAACALCLTSLILFRLNYFGYPLPNTYYAKMSPDKLHDIRFGIIYLYQFVAMNKLAVVPILVAAGIVVRYTPSVLAILIWRDGKLSAAQLGRFCIGSATLAGILLPVLMGGDIFGAFRFYQPIWPLLILTVLLLPLPDWFKKWNPKNNSRWVIAVIALCIFTMAHDIRWPSVSEDRGRAGHLYELTHRGILTGQYVQEIFSPDQGNALPTIGASAAGGYKMGYPGTVIDTMGLNFTPMAHHSGDKKGERGHASFSKEIFWQYPADLLEPTLCPVSKAPTNHYNNPGNWVFEIYQHLPIDSKFTDAYRFAAIEAPASGGWLCTYIKRDLLQSIQDQGRYQVVLVD